jgi:hypothetical protein
MCSMVGLCFIDSEVQFICLTLKESEMFFPNSSPVRLIVYLMAHSATRLLLSKHEHLLWFLTMVRHNVCNYSVRHRLCVICYNHNVSQVAFVFRCPVRGQNSAPLGPFVQLVSTLGHEANGGVLAALRRDTLSSESDNQ